MSRFVRRLLRLPIDLLVGIAVVLDEIARPLWQPVVSWFAGLRLVARMEAWIAAQHRYLVLALLAVPFAVAEPLKIVGLVLMARGAWTAGLVVLAAAYLASFLLVERIYHAGRAQLLTIRWFAAAMGLIVRIRTAVLGWVRATTLWREARALAQRIREAVLSRARRLADWLRERLR